MPQSVSLPGAVFHLLGIVLISGVVGAAAAPSHPGASDEAPFAHRQVPPSPQGTAILNVDTGMTFASIQDAVNAASAGDTLRVQVPVHVEGQILVDRDLTLEGATGAEEVHMGVDTGSSGDNRAWFLVDTGVDLQVRDLVFDGNGFEVFQAFRHKGTGSFEDCLFRAIRFEPSGPAYQGTGIVAFGGNVDVRNVTFENNGRVGVLFFGTGVAGSVAEDNVYVGKGDGDFLDYGLEVGAGANVTLRRNEARDCRGVASVDGSESAGVLISTFFGGGTVAAVTSNTLVDNRAGVTVGFGPDTSTVDMAFNRIAGSVVAGLGSTSAAVTAENNWWGCNDGPGMAGCDGVVGSGMPDFDPWLVLALMADPGVVPTAGMSVLTADLIRNSDGVDVSGFGNVPDGTSIAFAGVLGMVTPQVVDTVDGIAESAFTAGATGGMGGASATLDAQEVSVGIEILRATVLGIPALSPLGLGALVLLLAAFGLATLRRRSTGS